jgi:hypothetical protein
MAVRLPGAEHVTLATEGAEQFRGVALINLPSKALNVDLNQVGKRIESFVPNMFCDLSPAHYLINVAGEIVEQSVFLSGKFDGAF